MGISQLIAPWSGDVYRHISANARHHVLDFSRLGSEPNNRWNVRGEPTLYTGGDRGVVIGEFARHLARDRPEAIRSGVLQRRLYQLRVEIPAVLDLCHPDAWAALSITDAPHCFLDKEVARAVARFVRLTTPAQAIRVPSMAFLDDLTRWALVLFLEKLPADRARFITACAADDLVSIEP